MRKQVLAVTIGVLLVLSVFSVLQFWQIKPAFGSTIFSSGFESGGFISDGWTGTEETASYGNVTVQSDIKHHDTYGMQSNISSTAAWTSANAYKDFSAQTTLFVRFYFNLTSISGNAPDILGIGVADDNLLRFIITADRYLRIIYRNATVSTTDTSATQITLNAEYSLEANVIVSATVGEARIYLDGSEIADVTQTGLNNSDLGASVTRIRLGCKRGYTATAKIYLDCVVIADAYIGVESGASGVTFSEFGTTTTIVGASCKFYVNCTALSGTLNYSIFSTNNTGSWVNDTEVAFSGATWINTTKILNYTTYTYVQWKLYANTTEGDWSETGIQQLITTPSNVAYAESGSSTDIQAAVDEVAAIGGGTVYVPAGNYTFVIPSGKTTYGGKHAGVIIPGGVDVIGVGNNQTILYCNNYFNTSSNVMFAVDGSNDKAVRISGIFFQGEVHGHLDTYPQQLAGIILWGAKNARIDHCTFWDLTDAAIGTSNNYVHNADGNSGVIDHCIIDNPYKDWYKSVTGVEPYWAYGIVIMGEGYPTFNADYTQFFGKYGPNIWYIEDSSFARCRHMIAGGAESNAFYCLRYCTMYDMIVHGYGSYQDVHGGGEGAECYNNTVINVGGSGIGFYSRGGFALYYNNTIKDIPQYGAGIRLTNDQTNVDYRTRNVWVWGNTYSNVATPFDTVPNSFPITENIEYFLRAPTYALDGWTYTPYAYPHPLTVGPTSPSYSNVGFNTTLAAAECEFSAKIYDNDGEVSGSIFSTNNTGIWQNETWTALSGTVDWANVTKTLNSTVGAVVSFRWYFNDSDNLWGDTGIWSLTTTSGGTNTLELVGPDDAVNQTSNLATFTFIPFFADAIENASLWLNISGIWQFTAWNTTAIVNDTNNEITFNFGAYPSATYVWNIKVYSATEGVLAPTNRTMNVLIDPICESLSYTETTKSVPCTFSAVYSDQDGLNGYIGRSNNTGSWINQTWTSFIYGNANFTLTLNGTIGNVVQYQFFGNDTDNHWTTSPLGTLTITNVIVTITSPTNTTYTSSTVTVEFTASGGTIDEYWFNAQNGSSWIYVSNQTGNTGSFTGFVNDVSYTGYFWANNTDGTEGVTTVMFSVSMIGGTSQIIVNVWWSSWW